MRAIVLTCWLVAAGCTHDTAAAPPATPSEPVVGSAPAKPEPAASCIARHGCRAIKPLAKCAAGLTTLSLAAVTAHGASSLGKEIAVRGPLRHTITGCTENRCALGECCQQCVAHLVLATRDDVRSFDGARDAILLEGMSDRDIPTRCEGDESAVCCAVRADGADVVAQGMLARADDREVSHTWQLLGPTLCAP